MTKQMTPREQSYQELKDMLLNLKVQANLKVLISNDADFTYGYVITERDTILCISHNKHNSYLVAYQYKPSRQHGSGCHCRTPNGERFAGYVHTPEELEVLERSGIALADELGATHYQSVNEWLNGRWNIDQLVEL